MSPSVNQRGEDHGEYESQADRILAEWDESALKLLHPTGEELAREYLGMAHKHDRSQRVKNHFANIVEKEKD